MSFHTPPEIIKNNGIKNKRHDHALHNTDLPVFFYFHCCYALSHPFALFTNILDVYVEHIFTEVYFLAPEKHFALLPKVNSRTNSSGSANNICAEGQS